MKFLCLVILLLLSSVRCSRQGPTAQQAYVIQSNKETQRLTDAGRKWGAAVQSWRSGGVANLAAAEEVLEELEELVAKIRQDFNARTIPAGDAAIEYHRVTNEYLDWQLSARGKCAELHAFIEQNTPASEDDIAFFDGELAKFNQEENGLKAKSDEIAKRLGVKNADTK